MIFGLFFVFVYSNPSPKRAIFIPSKPSGPYAHFQSFNDGEWSAKYVKSKEPEYNGQWAVEKLKVTPNDEFLFTKTANAKYALSTKFKSPLKLYNSTLAIQFEAYSSFPYKCGGAYLRVYNADIDPTKINSKTPYLISFGPDFCDPVNRVHFSFFHKNKKTGNLIEHSLKTLPTLKNDKSSHLYTLVIRPDNSFEILIDAMSYIHGSLLDEFIFTPPVNPPKEIIDKNDKKPADWDENQMVFDKNAKKPDDWDENEPEFISDPKRLKPPEGWLENEPEMIPNPSATRPVGWDEEFFGKWEAPLIDNPKCKVGCGVYVPPSVKNPKFKGRWIPPRIKNPEYKGKWTPRKIPNPEYYNDVDVHRFEPVGGIGFHVTTKIGMIGINNILVSKNELTLHKFNKHTFFLKMKHQSLENNGKMLTKKLVVDQSEPVQLAQTSKPATRSETGFEKAEQKKSNEVITLLSSSWTNLSATSKIIVLLLVVLVGAVQVVALVKVCVTLFGESKEDEEEEEEEEEEVVVVRRKHHKIRETTVTEY
ncbi:Calnexin like protein [Tritrichomonas foetus]|uniref:Calnexin like protein n=1 Tax=Tritrichomonas foetus TaxID=1144522 RepID=A0A1J4J936_9EUKA|nr:Calnexin like protein [Tritrichomonas foetus]|eukprot:OHS95694.1 Calnexin like protein [Tritrichomonas foetus]